eukprot:758165-Hanusia_phi.AAC.1
MEASALISHPSVRLSPLASLILYSLDASSIHSPPSPSVSRLLDSFIIPDLQISLQASKQRHSLSIRTDGDGGKPVRINHQTTLLLDSSPVLSTLPPPLELPPCHSFIHSPLDLCQHSSRFLAFSSVRICDNHVLRVP